MGSDPQFPKKSGTSGLSVRKFTGLSRPESGCGVRDRSSPRETADAWLPRRWKKRVAVPAIAARKILAGAPNSLAESDAGWPNGLIYYTEHDNQTRRALLGTVDGEWRKDFEQSRCGSAHYTAVMKTCLVFFFSTILVFTVTADAQPEHPRKHAHELMGFLLRQDRKAIESELGKPFHADKDSGGSTGYAYHLAQSKHNYMVFFYGEQKDSEEFDKAIKVQITGDDPTGPTGFFGLKLGDSEATVEAALGKPDKTAVEQDERYVLWDYTSRNYSLEFTAEHKLFSIQILDQNNGETPNIAGHADAYAFAQSIKNNNIEDVMNAVSGEIECSTQDAFGIQNGSARRILSDPKSPISVCLQRAASVILAMGPTMRGTDDALRVWERHSPGSVAKFPKKSPLLEVVFSQEAGKFRVYEVTFR